MGLHVSCDVKDCDSVEKVEGHHDIPLGWSDISTSRQMTERELAEFHMSMSHNPLGGSLDPYEEIEPPTVPIKYVACEKHDMPEPKEGAGEYTGLRKLVRAGRAGIVR